MLTPNKTRPPARSRRWLAAVAAVAVLALIGGLIVAANRDADEQPADQPDVTVPTTTAEVGEESASLPDVEPSLVGPSTGGSAIFPETGNDGYEVSVYDWDLALSDDLTAVSGTATITATATQDLQQFSFDARGLQLESLTVNESPAEFALIGAKLIITTSEPIQAGAEFVVGVTYDAEPVENPGPLTRSNSWKVVPGEHMLLGG
jgi:hypothetical protein